MMRKFSKLIALVLAIAVVLCPMLSTVASAEATNDLPYSFSYDEETGLGTVSFEGEAFLVSLFKLQLNNFELNGENAVAVTYAADADGEELDVEEYKAEYYLDAESGVLSVVVMSKDTQNITMMTELEFTIALACTNTAEYKVGLIALQAATAGEYDLDAGAFVGDEALLAIDGTDGNTGLIADDILADYAAFLTYSKECVHDLEVVAEGTIPATCTEPGLNVLVCANGCGYTTTEDVAALGHNYTKDYVYQEATCGQEGILYIAYLCDRCDQANPDFVVEGNTDVIDPTGAHTWDEGQVTTDPTYDAAGVMTYTCTVCGDTKTDEIPALQHEVADVWSTDEENHWKECSCGAAHDLAAHVDEDANGACDTCGYEMEVDCEHANATLEYEVIDDGSAYGLCVTTLVCADCDSEVVVEEVANIKFGHAPLYESDLTLMFRIDNVALDPYSSAADYSDIDAVLSKDIYEKVTNVKLQPAVSTLKLEEYNATRQQVVYGGIRAMDMNSNINCSIYGTDDEGYRVLIAYEDYTMVDYIKAIYDLRINATSAKHKAERTLVVDMANYGAAAQTHFKYNTDNLANKDIEQTYASKTIALNEFTSTGPVATPAVTWNRAPEYENKVLMNLRFQKSQAPAGSYIVMDYYTIRNKQLTADSITYTDFQDYDNNRFQITFEEILAPTIPQEFTATLYAQDGTPIGSHTYSLEAYAYTITNGNYAATEKALVNTMINYGRTSYTYLTTN